MKQARPKRLRRWGRFFIVVVVLSALGWYFMIRMPGKSWEGPLPPITEKETALAAEMQAIVTVLGTEIGERNVTPYYEALKRSVVYIESLLAKTGYEVEKQTFKVQGRECVNLIVEKRGNRRTDEIVVIAAHYDSVIGSPGANDNGTGVAAGIALAKAWFSKKTERTFRFVFVVNEEPPYFQTEAMGSMVYAQRCRERNDHIVAMFSLETMGCFSDEKGSQKYSPPLGFVYPSTGNFITFVGNVSSASLVRTTIASFRKHVQFPSEGGALPGFIPGIGWSDHWAFWKAGYKAIMITDTAPFRYPHYHMSTDTPDKVDYEKLARVVAGLEIVFEDIY